MDEKQVQQEVQKTLDLLSPASQVKPDPFFYTRLSARMTEEPGEARGFRRLLHPGFATALAAIALLVALNAYSLVTLSSHSDETRNRQAAASLAQDYGIAHHPY
jgi:hypothetical protein